MVMFLVEFEWDEDKERLNLSKHGISFAEAIDTFFDPNGIQLIDEGHSSTEKRYYWIGKSKSGRVLTTYFTKRGRKIRIIGCAKWRKFRRIYNETTKVE